MKSLRLDYPVVLMSRVFQVSKSGFYAWLNRPPAARTQQEERLRLEIRAAHERTRRTYGPERLQCDLAEQGLTVGVHRIKRIRRELGLRCKQKRRFRATTDSRHRLAVADNLLGQQFTVHRPNQAWVSDITYIPTAEGWLYLAGIKDLYSGQIVGYAMAEHMQQTLVSEALHRALCAKRPAPGLIHHSDRGSQYCAHEYQRTLRQYRLQASMSGRGNCYDNAPMESFWGTLKNELVHHRRFETRGQAQAEIGEYIEVFYNRQRKQARLGYLSPAAFERRFYQQQAAVC